MAKIIEAFGFGVIWFERRLFFDCEGLRGYYGDYGVQTATAKAASVGSSEVRRGGSRQGAARRGRVDHRGLPVDGGGARQGSGGWADGGARGRAVGRRRREMSGWALDGGRLHAAAQASVNGGGARRGSGGRANGGVRGREVGSGERRGGGARRGGGSWTAEAACGDSEYKHRRLVRSRGAATTAVAGIPGFHFATIPDGLPESDALAAAHARCLRRRPSAVTTAGPGGRRGKEGEERLRRGGSRPRATGPRLR
uniref:Uncharacterized protein n=1 Tax=Oryza sativa subsp. japonica TaxID=39947 RepID=Q6YYI3_ORYSJ|nr:hypothetical protein [Oryza sativa Japonica Group]BAD16245.1 hypothetical protein [Oryza sativa Japonica Group]